MTEELLILYKELYKSGGVLFKQGKEQKLTITFTDQPRLYAEHQFPEYEYSKAYATRFLRTLK
jgi:hypothetical protein